MIECSPRPGRPFVRTPYNYDRDAVSEATGLLCTDPSRARQEFANEANINSMLERFGVTGQISLDARKALSGAFEDVGDYRTLLDLVQAADEAFNALPAQVRRDFDNDPAKFCDFACDPSNLEALRKYGLAPEQEQVFGLGDVVKAIEKRQEAKPLPPAD